MKPSTRIVLVVLILIAIQAVAFFIGTSKTEPKACDKENQSSVDRNPLTDCR
jgi:lipopolysaccharide export system protein LptC